MHPLYASWNGLYASWIRYTPVGAVIRQLGPLYASWDGYRLYASWRRYTPVGAVIRLLEHPIRQLAHLNPTTLKKYRADARYLV
ncbi:hypothetical protein [Neobacillus sp. FSL H8-0543]|uniref:hypothetical protein n=1 Tax=Neobacillus sp. FSL H8-0543 TaxID=2954672 RepID=UPI0031592726